MFIYFAGLFLSLIFSNQYLKKIACKNYRSAKWMAFFSAVPLTIISAIRFDVGTDYQPDYYYLSRWMNNPAFKIIYGVMIRFSLHYQWIYVFTSIFISFFVFSAIYQKSINPPLSIFLYVGSIYYFVGMNGTRQFCAISLCLYGMKYLVKKGAWWKYVACVMIAATFHKTAIVMLVLLIVRSIPITRTSLILYGVILSAGFIVLPLLRWVLKNIPYYGAYVGSIFDEQSFEIAWFSISFAVIVLSLLFYDAAKKNQYFEIMFKSLLISFGVLLYSAQIPLTKRIAWYFAVPQIILIPIILDFIPKGKIQCFFKISIIVSYSMTCIVGIGVLNVHECLPYQTFFTHPMSEIFQKPSIPTQLGAKTPEAMHHLVEMQIEKGKSM